MSETRTAEEWCHLLGWWVLDPDGWRADGLPWETAITRQDFERRVHASTAQQPPASPLPEGRADGRAAAWEEGFKAGGRWSLLDEEWFEDSQDFDAGDLPPRPPKPANPYDAAPVVGEREEKP